MSIQAKLVLDFHLAPTRMEIVTKFSLWKARPPHDHVDNRYLKTYKLGRHQIGLKMYITEI